MLYDIQRAESKTEVAAVRELSYKTFLDKVYGCFLGKAVSGNIGAPHEGVKMAMELPFLPSMIDCDRPNDDLDLQVLWLAEAERKGPGFTSADLLRSFAENCDYSPGEYAVMRKNYLRGIDPPLSGQFCNDIYTEGMGCPIRSEIWACLAPGNAPLASEFAGRDGCIDHGGESIFAEQFLAVLESEAFFCDDIRELIRLALEYVPEGCRFRQLVCDTVDLCDRWGDIKTVRSKLLFTYGHPDCTNMFQNLGITIASLLLGEGDIIKTSMMALNCGFDTDCTCATAGAVIGILRGAKELNNAYGLTDATFALGVRCRRRSNRIADLAEDIARLAVAFTGCVNTGVSLTGSPKVQYSFEPLPELETEICYENDLPVLSLGESRRVKVRIINCRPGNRLISVSAQAEHGVLCRVETPELAVSAEGSACAELLLTLPENTAEIWECNTVTLTLTEDETEVLRRSFGIVGATPWKLSGPFWHTKPNITTEKILSHITDPFPYKALMDESDYGENLTDKKRHFHLNFEADTDTAFLTQEVLFAPVRKDFAAPDHEEVTVFTPEDTFRMEDFMGFRGPCVVYLSRIIVLDEPDTVFMQIGHSAPFALYLNGRLLAQRKNCDNWTNENVHLEGNVQLCKGENRLVLRMTRVNRDATFNVTFSRGKTCAEHIVGWRSKNPACF